MIKKYQIMIFTKYQTQNARRRISNKIQNLIHKPSTHPQWLHSKFTTPWKPATKPEVDDEIIRKYGRQMFSNLALSHGWSIFRFFPSSFKVKNEGPTRKPYWNHRPGKTSRPLRGVALYALCEVMCRPSPHLWCNSPKGGGVNFLLFFFFSVQEEIVL